MSTIGKRIAEARRKAKLTQPALAKKCGWPSQSRVSNYERDEREPRSADIKILAKALRVSEVWLLTAENESSVSQPQDVQSKMIPLISWVTAGAWEDPIDNHAVGDAEEWLPCPPNCQAGSTFALNITGDSMDDGSKDGYRDGEIIFVDGSQIEPKHNSDVVVKNGGGKVTFKRLLNSNGTWYLKPLNPDWPDKIIELDEHAALVGRVLFSGKFR